MKKLLVLLMMFMTIINISAQESNELQKIDSLQYQIDRLQHNYDYLDCEYKLNKIMLELNIYASELKISVNSLSMNFYHGGYDEKIYQINKKNYEVCKDNLEEKEQLIFWTKLNVKQKMESVDFYETEINVLKSSFDTIDAGLYSAKTALEYYKGVLDAYRDCR